MFQPKTTVLGNKTKRTEKTRIVIDLFNELVLHKEVLKKRRQIFGKFHCKTTNRMNKKQKKDNKKKTSYFTSERNELNWCVDNFMPFESHVRLESKI